MKLRRTIIIACCVIIASLGIALTGCGGNGGKYADSPYVGEWVANVAEYAGIEMDVADVGGSFEITLNADGSASMLIKGPDSEEGATEECEWEPTEGGMEIKGSLPLEFTDKDGKLVTEMSGVTYYLDKK